MVTDWEHATGIELKELEAAAEGKDYFDHFDFLKQVRGVSQAVLTIAATRHAQLRIEPTYWNCYPPRRIQAVDFVKPNEALRARD